MFTFFSLEPTINLPKTLSRIGNVTAKGDSAVCFQLPGAQRDKDMQIQARERTPAIHSRGLRHPEGQVNRRQTVLQDFPRIKLKVSLSQSQNQLLEGRHPLPRASSPEDRPQGPTSAGLGGKGKRRTDSAGRGRRGQRSLRPKRLRVARLGLRWPPSQAPHGCVDVLTLLTRQPGQNPTGFNTGDGPGTVSSAMDAFGSTARRNLCGSPFCEPLETRLFPATVLTASRSGLGGCGPAN